MNTLQIKLTIVGILTVFSAYSIKRVSWSQKTNFGSNSKSQSFSISNSHSHNPEEDRSTDSIQGTGRKLGPSDWVNDLPTNYSLLNQTCPYKPKSALNSALLISILLKTFHQGLCSQKPNLFNDWRNAFKGKILDFVENLTTRKSV